MKKFEKKIFIFYNILFYNYGHYILLNNIKF